MKNAAYILGLIGAAIAIAWATDEYVHAQIQEDLRPVAEILAGVVKHQQILTMEVRDNRDHRVRAAERARLNREGWTPPSPQGDSK